MGRTLIVSHRLPVQLAGSAPDMRLVRSSGGLVAGLEPVWSAGDSLWIGTLGGGAGIDTTKVLEDGRLVQVEIPEEEAKRHYEGFANGVLWPLLHYFVETIRFDPLDYAAYRSVNQRFAEVVLEHARPGDRIWIHDYHLLLLPGLVRERLPDAAIGFFLHVPFPSPEIFRILPMAEVLLRGLAGANLVGVHSYDYARYLVSTYRRLLGAEFHDDFVTTSEGVCKIGVFPLGVDFQAHDRRSHEPSIVERVANLRERFGARKVILGVDRMDYSKGLVPRLQAYRLLLERAPEWRENSVFLQLAVPSRATIPRYQETCVEVERHASEINGAFGAPGRVCVEYLYQSVTPDELSALYQLADVVAVTPLRDGMNLVAKEFVASRRDDRGVLVLSQFAGAAAELGEALIVNPWDIEGMASAFERALRMTPEEQARRMRAMRARVASRDVQGWARGFLGALTERKRSVPRAASIPDSQTLVRAFRLARQALILLDYDGTLRAFENSPEASAPGADLVGLLGQLAALARTEVALISGRDVSTLERWFGDLPLSLVAEHGFSLRMRGEDQWTEVVPDLDHSWIPAVRGILETYADRTPGAHIEEKAASISWHYRQVDPGMGVRHARELANHIWEYFGDYPLQVVQGNRVVEVRIHGIHKGLAYRGLRRRLGPCDFVLAAGDDRTDEDLFRALPAASWSIKVGETPSVARYHVADPDALRAVLEALCAGAVRSDSQSSEKALQ